MKRFYREWTGQSFSAGLHRKTLVQEESDIEVFYSREVAGIEKTLAECRSLLKDQIRCEPAFLTSLEPLPIRPEDAPLIRQMKEAAAITGVGPMAAVAGSVAEYVGCRYRDRNPSLMLENGGDLYLSLMENCHVMIHAGNSPLSNRLTLKIRHDDTPLGISTSSGTFGHSLSFGKADAVAAVSRNSALADAAATAIANRVKCVADIEDAVSFAAGLKGLMGVVVIVGEKLGAWGAMELGKSPVR